MKRLKEAILIIAALLAVWAAAGAEVSDRVTLTLVSTNGSVVFRETEIKPTDHLVAAEIFERRINAPYADKVEYIQSLIKTGVDYKTALTRVFPRLENDVDKFLLKANREAVPAEIRFDPSRAPMFTIYRERPGVKVTESRVYHDIYTALPGGSHVRVTAKETTVKPTVAAEDLINETSLRVRYSTSYAASNADRKHNVRLALKKIDGTVLKRGETFSFNDTVGRRTAANGFKEAKIIVDGKYEPGYGGGVCQASTTLYNGALLAGLDVTEARSHSLKVAYEKASFDAMVNSSSSDLKFVNNSSSPVYLHCYGTDDNAVIEVYGVRLPYVVKRKSVVIKTGPDPGYEEELDSGYRHFAPDAESGTRKVVSYPHSSLTSEGYLEYYDRGGRRIKSVLLRRDTYYATKGVIAVAP